MNSRHHSTMPWNLRTEEFISNIFNKSKEARVRLFMEKLKLGPNDSILDLGSEDGLGGYTIRKENEPRPFSDNQFSAVWCNSVIEHVTLNKDSLCDIKKMDFIVHSTKHQT